MNTVREEKIIDQIQDLLKSPELPTYTREFALERMEVNISTLITQNILEIAGSLSRELEKIINNFKLIGIINLQHVITDKVKLIENIFDKQDMLTIVKKLLTDWGYKFEVIYIDDVAHAEVTI